MPGKSEWKLLLRMAAMGWPMGCLRHVSGRATVVGVEQTLELFPRGKSAIFCYETMAGDVLKSDEIGINVCLSWMDSSDHQSMYIDIYLYIYIYVCVCARVCLQMCNKGNSGWIHLESFALSLCNPHTSPGQRPTSPSHSHHRQPRRALGAPDSEGFSPLRRG